MKKIETTNIAGAAKAPYIKATHDHYNEAIALASSEIIKGLIGIYTTNDVIILRGCEVTATIPGTSSVTAGSIYYNGEIYEVDANASISTPSNTLVWGIVTTYRAGDPFAWSDGTSRNLHRVDKFQLTNAATGTGLADYNASTVKLLTQTKILNIGDWDMDTNATVSVAHGLGDRWKKIKSISATVRNDADTVYVNDRTYSVILAEVDLLPSYSSTNAVLRRLTGGELDSTDYNATSYNRGFIYIRYGDI